MRSLLKGICNTGWGRVGWSGGGPRAHARAQRGESACTSNGRRERRRQGVPPPLQPPPPPSKQGPGRPLTCASWRCCRRRERGLAPSRRARSSSAISVRLPVRRSWPAVAGTRRALALSGARLGEWRASTHLQPMQALPLQTVGRACFAPRDRGNGIDSTGVATQDARVQQPARHPSTRPSCPK